MSIAMKSTRGVLNNFIRLSELFGVTGKREPELLSSSSATLCQVGRDSAQFRQARVTILAQRS